MLGPNVVNTVYLIAAVLFILDLTWMAHPKTAVRGNVAGAVGMGLAILATLLSQKQDWSYIIIGVVIGTIIGGIAGLRVKMTSMPEMVGLFNGFGGGASILVAGAALVAAFSALHSGAAMSMQARIATVASGIIGSVTFFGSYVAFGKLAEFLAVTRKLRPWQRAVKYGVSLLVAAGGLWYGFVSGAGAWAIVVMVSAVAIAGLLLMRSDHFPGMNAVKLLSAIASVLLGVLLVMQPENLLLYWALVGVAGILGVILTISIGGADMPVVIALLNSYSGLAAAATGFVINNTVLIIAGSLVGASGIILTNIMCKAMNRSLLNVLFGTIGPTGHTPDADEVYKTVKAASAEEIAMILDGVQRVLIVPGYGMAVAQAQHAVRELAAYLESMGINVEFGIHPVAGRMPGHMNVLLAEANVSYDKLKEMDEVNAAMEQVDVAIVLGANDVVNPVARTDPSSAIAGMPIINVDKARTVVVIKRSLGPGFAGIPNPLFAAANTLMFFGDGKKALVDLMVALKEL
ncbi:MAG: NAD(P)(+) transhydrogenase (Re/Si-specific) subunit beta [Acidobacteria bacterium]|nr:NAD(P)(+) transhydrogenase (Re/Si-specific) subunit beta [Acidobacteriota bacterium]